MPTKHAKPRYNVLIGRQLVARATTLREAEKEAKRVHGRVVDNYPHLVRNPRPARNPAGEITFSPSEQAVLVGKTQNPRDWVSRGGGLIAQLFLGLSVGEKPTYRMTQVIPVVTDFREKQGYGPDSSFIAQRGAYTSKLFNKDDGPRRRDSEGNFTEPGKVVRENSVQILLFDTAYPPSIPGVFIEEIEALAEELAQTFHQEEVICTVTNGGKTIESFGVKPIPPADQARFA